MTLDDLAGRLPEVAELLRLCDAPRDDLTEARLMLAQAAVINALVAEVEGRDKRIAELEAEVEGLRERRLPCREAEIAQQRYERAEAELAELRAKVDVLQVCGNCEHYSSSLYECDVKEPRHPRGGDCDCSDACYFTPSRWATSKRPCEPKNIVIRQGLFRERIIGGDVSGEG